MAENGSPKYQKVAVRGQVLVHVPSKSNYMNPLGECQFENNGNPVKIEQRWMNGMLVDKVILNRNFYGIVPTDLGKKIVATVGIIVKTVCDGRKFTMLDIYKMPPDKSPTHRLKIIDDVGGFPILGTTKSFHFIPLDLMA